MERITNEDLNDQIDIINELIGGEHSYNKAYGQGYRLYKNGQSTELSPRVSKRELFEFLRAYKMGILEGKLPVVTLNEAENLKRSADYKQGYDFGVALYCQLKYEEDEGANNE